METVYTGWLLTMQKKSLKDEIMQGKKIIFVTKEFDYVSIIKPSPLGE